MPPCSSGINSCTSAQYWSPLLSIEEKTLPKILIKETPRQLLGSSADSFLCNGTIMDLAQDVGYKPLLKIASKSLNETLRTYSNASLLPPLPRKEIFKHSFSYSSVSVWNTLPLSMKASKSVGIFKNRAQRHVFTLSQLSFQTVFNLNM